MTETILNRSVVAEKAMAAFQFAANLPDGMYHSVDVNIHRNDMADVSLRIQAYNQSQVRTAMAALPHAIWAKTNFGNEWQYSAVVDGVKIRIYACSEAPPTCKAIEEEYEVEELVPVLFETRTVTKKRIRWDCVGGDNADTTP